MGLIRFSHKPYAVIDASRRVNSEILIWMDADSVVHSKVPIKFLDDLIEDRYFTHYLARKHPVQGSVYTECSWYSMNLHHQYAREFFNQFERMYEQAESVYFLCLIGLTVMFLTMLEFGKRGSMAPR